MLMPTTATAMALATTVTVRGPTVLALLDTPPVPPASPGLPRVLARGPLMPSPRPMPTTAMATPTLMAMAMATPELMVTVLMAMAVTSIKSEVLLYVDVFN